MKQVGADAVETRADPARTSATGARPAGVRDEGEAAREVREMFGRIAPRYDFLNHFLSLSLDRLWRRRTAERLRVALQRDGARALDLCCGTGDLTFALERAAGPKTMILGSDFSQPMLQLAQKKARGASRRSSFLAADALALPFADGSVDVVTSAFGFRNLANYERGLQEIARVLRPRGQVGILEFAEPRGKVLGPLYRFYFERVLPKIGGAISGNSSAYTYLPGSVARFPSPEELRALMIGAGFTGVRFETWTFGIVALHTARK